MLKKLKFLNKKFIVKPVVVLTYIDKIF